MHKRSSRDKSKDSKNILTTNDSIDALLRKEKVGLSKGLNEEKKHKISPRQEINHHYRKIEKIHKRHSLSFLKDESQIIQKIVH